MGKEKRGVRSLGIGLLGTEREERWYCNVVAALMIFFMTEIKHLCLPNAGAKYNRKRSRNYREYASSRMQVVRRSESSAFHRG